MLSLLLLFFLLLTIVLEIPSVGKTIRNSGHVGKVPCIATALNRCIRTDMVIEQIGEYLQLLGTLIGRISFLYYYCCWHANLFY